MRAANPALIGRSDGLAAWPISGTRLAQRLSHKSGVRPDESGHSFSLFRRRMLAAYTASCDSVRMGLWILLAIVLLILFMQFVAVVKRYVRVPPNRLLVIYGKLAEGKTCVVVPSGGRFIWPIIQDYCYLSTEPFTVNFPSGEKLTVRISRDETLSERAAERLLGLREEEIEAVVRDHMIQAGPQADRDTTLAKLGLVRSDAA